MRRKLFAGAAVKRLREANKWSQQSLAAKLRISASYLNQIEHNQRPLSAGLLIELSRAFRVDVSAFSDSGADRLLVDLREAFADPSLGGHTVGLTELKAAVQHCPNVARALLSTQASQRALSGKYQLLDDALSLGAVDRRIALSTPYDEVRDFFHRIDNYIDVLDRLGEKLRRELGGDGTTLCSRLSDRLESRHGVTVSLDHRVEEGAPVRHFDRKRKVLHIDGFADRSSQAFALAHQLALIEAWEEIQEVSNAACFQSVGAKQVGEIALANYFAGSVVLPYEELLEAAQAYRHDLDILTRLFGASIEQVAHRLSTMQRPSSHGIPFYFLRVDRAGNITKRHSATRLSFARYGGACPLWNVHEAFESADRLLSQIVEMPDGVKYLSIAHAITKVGIGRAPRRRYAVGLGCELADASHVVYADDLMNATPIQIGTSCRLCERPDCAQRAYPPLGATLAIDHDIRRAVPYAIGG